ncbi:UMP kinase [Methyloligella sp. 2.7D]|uniref:UMP kinase n=1 Tax=unclassified Methyloligella TaxID=2625955 RepID=UPI00157E24C3|nr:UMP kinase [Methyloligella sp. GL2]QKP77526.1 UMP kinase [Methyloligella sp. GL2]
MAAKQAALNYRRVLLKLSGEALMGDRQGGIDVATLDRIATDVAEAVDLGAEICLVVGGGNIYRGLAGAAQGMDRVSGDYMGMLATVLNGLALGSAIEARGHAARVMSAIPMPTVCEPFIRPVALQHLEKGRIVILAGGTGNPFFTTDTAAALRAAEMNCNALLKATQVDGVYSADPKKVPDATRFDALSFHEVLEKDLRIMDGAAIALARDNEIPIVVFSLKQKGGIAAVLQDKGAFTTIGGEGR